MYKMATPFVQTMRIRLTRPVPAKGNELLDNKKQEK